MSVAGYWYFNPRTPRGVRQKAKLAQSTMTYISIHAPREGCDYGSLHTCRKESISIHAPREGCDFLALELQIRLIISIHAPREGCDCDILRHNRKLVQFQSTHPARGATPADFTVEIMQGNFNPRTPRGVRLYGYLKLSRACMNFNPRTPRGVRRYRLEVLICLEIFQSTHPARGATQDGAQRFPVIIISIHAPREGCDWLDFRPSGPDGNFNPRTPRGVRLPCMTSTVKSAGISIHAPREGCDRCRRELRHYGHISIHAPREGCDHLIYQNCQLTQISIHAPREGCDTKLFRSCFS